jgi:hypothetical protein
LARWKIPSDFTENMACWTPRRALCEVRAPQLFRAFGKKKIGEDSLESHAGCAKANKPLLANGPMIAG